MTTTADSPAVVDITDPDQVASARARRDKKRAAALTDAITNSRGYSLVDTLTAAETVSGVPIHQLQPHPDNPRREVGDITDLTDDIRARGIDSPLTVVPLGALTGVDDRFQVVIGHRRLAAATAAGLTRVPCIIRDLTPAEQLAMMLRENVHRADLTPVEEADAIQGLLDLGLSVEAVAIEVARSESTVRRRARLAAAPEAARTAIHTGQATLEQWDQALTIAGDDPDTLAVLADAMGTRDFEWRSKEVQRERADEAAAAAVAAWLAERGVPVIDQKDYDRKTHAHLGSIEGRELLKGKDGPSLDGHEGVVAWSWDTSGRPTWVNLAAPVSDAELQERRAKSSAYLEEQAAHRAATEADRAAREAAKAEWQTARDCRLAFVAGRTTTDLTAAHLRVLVRNAALVLTLASLDDEGGLDVDEALDALSLLPDPSEDDDGGELPSAHAVEARIAELPAGAALLHLICRMCEEYVTPYRWLAQRDGVGDVDPRVATYYALLEALGYTPSTPELAVLGRAE